MVKTYEIEQDEVVHLIDGPYKGRRFRYDKVELVPDGDRLRLQFIYYPQDNIKGDYDFEQYIGRLLHEMIEESLFKKTTVFSGGTE